MGGDVALSLCGSRLRRLWGHGGKGGGSRRPPARWLALGSLALGLVVPAVGAHEHAAPALAVLSTHAQFLGDSGGTTLTFTITNPSDGPGIDTVDIDTPSPLWSAVSCPRAPAGWNAEVDEDGCRYDNPGSPAGDLAPGTSSSAFQLVAATGEAAANETGSFRVAVGDLDGSDNKNDLTPASTALPGDLDITAYSFQVLDVVVASSPPPVGAACPAANRTGTAGVDQALVVCGRNRTDGALEPAAAFSSLGGGLLQSVGTFSSGPIPGPSSANVVLGTWTGARTVRAGGAGTLSTSIGSSPAQTSPSATLSGYRAVAAPVVADSQQVTTPEDTPVDVVLTGSAGDGSPLTGFTVATGPAHGTLSAAGSSLVYTPATHYVGEDGFTFSASDGLSISPPASVAITVEPVNNPPAFARGGDISVVATAGPQRFVHWAGAISSGVADGSSQGLAFQVVGNTNPGLTRAGPAISPSGDLTFTPDAAASGTARITLVLVDGGSSSPPQTFTLRVVPPALPVADASRAATEEDTSTTLSLAAGDPGGGAVAFSVVTAPAHGSLGAIGPVTCSGSAATCSASVTYTPAAGYSGADSFVFAVSSRQGASHPALVSISVRPRPAAPPPPKALPKGPPKGPTLRALSLAKSPSGPPGVGIDLSGTGYRCSSVYFFLDGSRIGVAHPDPAGRVDATGLEVPGDTSDGAHTFETSCRITGHPVAVTTSFEVTSAGLHRSELMTSLPRPSDIHLTPKTTVASMLGAIALILLVAFPGELLDSTLEEHYGEIRAMLHLPAAREAPRQLHPALRALGLVGFLAAGAVAGALLDPRFGFNASTLALGLGLCGSLAVVFLGFELPGVAYHRGVHRDWGSIELHPGALILAALLVGVSRLLNLQPGYLFGVIGGLVFSAELRGRVEGRLAMVTSLFILAVALSAWFVCQPVSKAAASPHAGFWVVAAEAALGGIFLAGLTSLVVGLLPLREWEGATLKSWSMFGWVLTYLVGVFAYVLIVLRPAADAGTDPHGQMWKALVAAGVFAVLSIGFWAFFRLRSGGAEEGAEEGPAPAAG